MSMKNPKDTIGNQTRDLPTCSAVPQPTALPAACPGKVRQTPIKFDVHESVHRDTIMKVTNNMQLYRSIYYSKSALHVSGDVFAHHQEHVPVFTVSGSIHPSCCRLVSWIS
jgi:hypothetical protein